MQQRRRVRAAVGSAARVRAAVGSAAVSLALAGCASVPPTYPLGRPDNSSGGVTPLFVVLTYVVVPAAIVFGIAALVLLPGLIRTSRYRPQEGWSAEPVWFAGPPDPVAAVESAPARVLGAGGASGDW